MVRPFKRTETTPVANYSLFGKLPNRADFVRVNATHPVVLEFDELIQHAIEEMPVSDADAVEADVINGPVDFQYVAKDRRYVMLGVLTPSKDQAGRRYPLVAAAILPYETIGSFLPVSPIAYEVFYDGLREQVVNAVENSVEALSCRQYLETNFANNTTADDDLRLARCVVERFMSSEPAAHIDMLLSGGPYPSNLQQTLLNVVFYLAYLRRFDNRATNQILMFPLPASKGEQGLIASTWLTILSAMCSSAGVNANWVGSYLFVRHSGCLAQFLISIGRMPDSFSKVMLGGAIEDSMLLDISAENSAWVSHRMYAEASYALGRILANPDCRISELCLFLGDMSRQLESNI